MLARVLVTKSRTEEYFWMDTLFFIEFLKIVL